MISDSCWLLVVGCWLLVVGCWLLVVGCWLLVVGCWLLVVGCWLLVVGCWLFRSSGAYENDAVMFSKGCTPKECLLGFYLLS
ncbi:hypothetical protein EG358_09520 [Chryseobacterium indoltheticum]|nr:hypothetical protein EG358_09520 [Chryseobacterium indoltheticum]